jgi:aspartate aminotransferase
MREEFLRRRNVLIDGLRSLGLKCVVPKGAFYAFPEVDDCTKVAGDLIANGVVVVPGTAFGEGGDGHIRISYASSMPSIHKAFEIMEKVIT